MTEEWIMEQIISAVITCGGSIIGALIGYFAASSKTKNIISKLPENLKDLFISNSKEHNDLSKEHNGLSKEHDNILKICDNINKLQYDIRQKTECIYSFQAQESKHRDVIEQSMPKQAEALNTIKEIYSDYNKILEQNILLKEKELQSAVKINELETEIIVLKERLQEKEKIIKFSKNNEYER